MLILALIFIVLAFIVNPILGVVVIFLCIAGYFGFYFLMFWLADSGKLSDKTKDPKNQYKFWLHGTLYTCSLSIPENQAFDACLVALRKIGYIESIDTKHSVVTAKFGSKFGTKITLMLYSRCENTCRLIVLYKPTGALIGAYDRMWYKTVVAILEVSSATTDIKVSPKKPTEYKMIEENAEDIKYLYSNGRLKVKKKKHSPIFDNNMSGYDYEHFAAKCFRNSGYRNVTVTQKSGDYGADVVMTDGNGVRVCVQCKKSATPVGVQAVQEVIGAMFHYRCSKGMVVTTSTFTPAAHKLASEAGVELHENFRIENADDLAWIDRIEEIDSIIED